MGPHGSRHIGMMESQINRECYLLRLQLVTRRDQVFHTLNSMVWKGVEVGPQTPRRPPHHHPLYVRGWWCGVCGTSQRQGMVQSHCPR